MLLFLCLIESVMNKFKISLLLILILSFTVFLYWHGLKGDYVFDDSVNILENSKLKITELDYASLKAAYGSGDAGPLGRPISMLSFALNYYLQILILFILSLQIYAYTLLMEF
jgi:protein O-mannosyl-transferase